MKKIKDVNWHVLKGWSIEEEMRYHGLTFEGLEFVENAVSGSSQKLKTKVIGNLGKDLRSELMDENDGAADLNKMKYGTYVISVGKQFVIDYSESTTQSRVLYIGSGRVYGRIKSHLKGKLFDFVESFPTLRLRFHIVDFGDGDEAKLQCKYLEQALLQSFSEKIDSQLPLLNKNKALDQDIDLSCLPKGWDRPLHKDKGSNIIEWKIEPSNPMKWKGSL